MDPIVQFFKEEWALISSAPVSFVLISLLLCFIGYRIGRWQMTERLENAEKIRELARELAEVRGAEKPSQLSITNPLDYHSKGW